MATAASSGRNTAGTQRIGNLEILRNYKPLSAEEISALREYGKQFEDGRYELFKSTVKYDGDLGRQQHNFPPAADLPA